LKILICLANVKNRLSGWGGKNFPPRGFVKILTIDVSAHLSACNLAMLTKHQKSIPEIEPTKRDNLFVSMSSL
jgi:hypothetical protein